MTTPPPSTFHALLAAAFLVPVGSASAALAITNGGFGTVNTNAVTVSGGGWFESTTTTAWVEGSWYNGTYAAAFGGTNDQGCLFDGAAANGYIYQKIGTIDLSFVNGTMNLTSDFAEKGDDTTVNCTFSVYAGSFTGANGSDIAGGGLTQLFTRTLTPGDQGLTAGSGNTTRNVDRAVNAAPISLDGLAVGTEIWLRIGRPSSGAGDVIIDNVKVSTMVPEPSAALLGGLGILALLRRRR